MQRISLTPSILQMLRPALWGAIATIRQEIHSGISQLYITCNSNLYVVLRPEGQELVVVAIVGKNLKQSAREIINHAIARGFSTLRFHTLNPEHLQKGVGSLPFVLVEKRPRLLRRTEHVYKLELNYVL
jgi:hypothetical protein